jgi:hypothetical protein
VNSSDVIKGFRGEGSDDYVNRGFSGQLLHEYSIGRAKPMVISNVRSYLDLREGPYPKGYNLKFDLFFII